MVSHIAHFNPTLKVLRFRDHPIEIHPKIKKNVYGNVCYYSPTVSAVWVYFSSIKFTKFMLNYYLFYKKL